MLGTGAVENRCHRQGLEEYSTSGAFRAFGGNSETENSVRGASNPSARRRPTSAVAGAAL